MTHSPPSATDPDALEVQAVELVVCLMSGDATEEDAARVREWRSRGPANEAAFAEAARTWRGLRQAALAARTPALGAAAPAAPRVAVGRRAFLIGGAVAATAVALQSSFGILPSISELSADYRTAKGERRTLRLTPDIDIDLNTMTSVAVRSTTATDLSFELISGEAMIESRLGPDRQLSIFSGDGATKASNARFNVLCLDGAVTTVACANGTVEVRRQAQSVVLAAGRSVTYSGDGLTLPVEAARVATGTDGLLIFSNTTLRAVVDEVNRYRPGRIVILNADLARRNMNGAFRINRLSSFVEQVEQLFGARATALPGGLTILS